MKYFQVLHQRTYNRSINNTFTFVLQKILLLENQHGIKIHLLVIMNILQIVLWMGKNQIYQHLVENVRRHRSVEQQQCGGWTSAQSKTYTISSYNTQQAT